MTFNWIRLEEKQNQLTETIQLLCLTEFDTRPQT